MSNGSQKRTRSQRVAALELPPSRAVRSLAKLRDPAVLLRFALCMIAAVAIWWIAEGWAPAFPYRAGFVPRHDITARFEFTEPDPRNPNQRTIYRQDKTLARAGEPLVVEDVRILELEHEAALAHLTFREKAYRSVGAFGMLFALYALAAYYLVYREQQLIRSRRRLAGMLAMAVGTFAAARFLAPDPWRAELIPLLLFGLTVAIAYSKEMALLLAAAVSLLIATTLGQSLGEFMVLMGTTATAVLLIDRIRSRSKLIKVGVAAGVVAFFLTLGTEITTATSIAPPAFDIAARNMLWGFVAGFLTTGLLPWIERLFGVLTEISLLELGDAAHPLLQELVRRAPGTYNHSITVGSLGEAAAESIGANGLLVRVGAYFHDIGKMFKPAYFVENQGTDESRHEELVPAMSTLIIIAHVKDGADLARQHRVPKPIIDFIEQHHGTTLVEYFYHRANEQSAADPDAASVDEEAYRYPGLKPQSREAAVMMLADAVESASRVLNDPTPARIESLVKEIIAKRLQDDQLDECGLTFRQLTSIEESLIKSLTAVYHGRVKYPSQRTA